VAGPPGYGPDSAMQRGGTHARYCARIGTAALVWGLAARCLAYGRSKLDCSVERRRMNRIRRDPNALVTRLVSAKRVLIVCHGNIIRSPFTAALISQALGAQTALSISSGGLGAVPGKPAHLTAVRTAVKHGVNLTEHAAAPVTPEAVADADVIFLMDILQLAVMRRRFPEARAKTFLLTSLASDTPLELFDPVDGDEAVFHACFEHISSAVRPILRVLSARAQRP